MAWNVLKMSLFNLIGYRGGQIYDSMIQAIRSTTKVIMKEKQCKLLREIKKNKIGTNDVEHSLKRLHLGERTQDKLRTAMMGAKIRDAYRVLQDQRYENFKVWRRCRKVIPRHLLEGYLVIWRNYTREYRQTVDQRHAKKLSHLKGKWIKKIVIPDEIRGVSLSPDMNNLPAEFSSEPRLYGGVVLDDDEKLLLEFPVKFGLYRQLDITQCKIDTEEALNKLRWYKIIKEKEQRARERTQGQGEDDTETHDEQEEEVSNSFISHEKVVDINKLRVTDLPYNPSVMMPWSVGQEELNMHSFKRDVEELARRSRKYTSKWSNLDKARYRGLKKLQDRVAKKELVCFETDKSGRWACDTPENYKEACRSHLCNPEVTPVITEEEHNLAEETMNAQATALLHMLGIDNDAHGTRLRRAVVAHGVSIPAFYGTRKDHKTVPPGTEDRGPKVRPVCGAEDCVTKRSSYILCLIGSNLIEGEDTNCDSTITLLNEIERVNRSGKVRGDTIIGSLDIDALYPSLNIDVCARVFRDKLFHSTLVFPGLSWKDVALYLKYNISEEELVAESIFQYCPKKRTPSGQPPKFEASGIDSKPEKRFGPWVFPDTPSENTVRLMFCVAIENMIKVTMRMHDFQFDNTIYRQRTGGSIGLDLTGIISDVYMCHWDRELIRKCREQLILFLLYKRYKDDINVALDVSQAVDMLEKDDREVMMKLKEIADSIDPHLTVSTDCCSNHEDLKTPILDVAVWVEEIEESQWKILHSHYVKEVSTKQVMHERSSHGERMKFHIMVNEMDRIARNTSPHIAYDKSLLPNLQYFVKRMLYSGYSKMFVHNSLKRAMEKFDLRMDRYKDGKSYYDMNELKNKKIGKDWYVEEGKYESVIFVEATPKSEYSKNVRKLVQKHKLKIRVVEKAGETVKQILQRSDPFKNNKCNRVDCFVCRNEIPINCRERGIVYQLKCKVCDRKYRGQTGRSEYERNCEHIKDLENKVKSSPLYRHKELFHQNENFDIEVSILARCYGKASRRMITEAVLIGELENNETMNSKTEWSYTKLYKL